MSESVANTNKILAYEDCHRAERVNMKYDYIHRMIDEFTIAAILDLQWMKMIWCRWKTKENCHVLVNQFHGNFHSKFDYSFYGQKYLKRRLVVTILNFSKINCTFPYGGWCDCEICIISDFKFLCHKKI